MTASRLAFHPQDVRTPLTMASDNHLGGASVDLLLAHLESSKQALEHQVQQLLQENRSSKFVKKEQQWQIESKRFQSELENMNVTVKEKEDRICRLEKELREARNSILQVQSRCREAEKEKERGALERASLQADVEDAQANFQNLQREYKSKHDVSEKQRRALESLADKVEKQKEIFQNQLEDAMRRLMESEEREHEFEVAAQSASQQMAEKDRQIKSLRDAHEKLLSIQRNKQAQERNEVREVIQVLESTQAKCEEQKKLIKELELELGKTRKEAHRRDARASVAEANASAKAILLEKVQLELKNTSSNVVPLTKATAHIEDLKTQIETLKRSLQDEEDALSEERTLRFKAECTIDEYKVRERSLLQIEQDGKALKEEIKWRNEQFALLEEAHNQMRDQLHDGRNMWASEKAALLREIEALTKSVQSRDTVVHDLRSQVKLLQKSLAHEENCRKLVEFQLADAKAGMESVSAEFLSVQSILEMLRVNSKTELSYLKDKLTEKDKHLKELHDKQKQIDHDQKLRLSELEAELDNYKSNCEHFKELQDKQKQIDHDQDLRLTELEVELDNYKSNCEQLNELHDKQRQIDQDQKLRLTELEAELNNYKSNCEQLKELHDEHKQIVQDQKSRLSELEAELDNYKSNCEHFKELQDKQKQIDHDQDLRLTELEVELDNYKSNYEQLNELHDKQRQIDQDQKLRLTELEAELNNYKSNCEQLKELHDEHKQIVQDQKSRLSELEAELDNYKSNCEHFKELQDKQKQIDHDQDLRLTELEVELDNYKSNYEQLNELHDKQRQIDQDQKLRLTELEAELNNYKSNCEQLKELHDEHKQIVQDQKSRLSELEAELDNYKSNCEHFKELQDKQKQIDHDQDLRLTELEVELDNYKSNYEQLNELHDKQRQIDQDQKLRLTELEAELNNYKSNCEQLKELHDEHKQIVQDQKSRLSELEAELDNYKSNCEQLKELHDNQKQIDQDQKLSLTELRAELDNYKNNCEHLQQALENRAEQEILAMAIKGDDVLDSEEIEHLIQSLSDAETTVAAKDVEMKELKMELDRSHTLAELLRTSLAEAESNSLEEKSSLKEAIASLFAKQHEVMELEVKLEKLRAVVNDVCECKTEAEAKVTLIEERRSDAQRELQENKSLSNRTLLDVHEKEDVLAVRSECESLRQQLRTCETERGELKKHHELLVAEAREKKLLYQKKEELLGKLEHLGRRCLVKDSQLSDLHDQIESQKKVISTLEARCSTSEQELSKQLALVEHAPEEVNVWKLTAQAYKETEAEAKFTLLEERLSDAQRELQENKSLSNRTVLDVHEKEDAVLAVRSDCESLRQQLHTCETERHELEKHHELLVAESREKKLMYQKEKEELLGKLEHLGKRCLMKESQLSDLHDQIERKKKVIITLEARCSTSEQELSKQFALVEHAREEVDVWKLNAQAYKERAQALDTPLSTEAAAKDSSLQEIKGALQEQTREAKDSKAIIDNLYKNLKTAEDAASTRSGELHELRKELESKSMHLLSIAEQTRVLEDKVRETETIVHDKEQRLAASEWTVQQLASEIAKSKSFLTQKERNEVASKDRLSHVETHLKEKEREFIELHCDLENAVKTSNERYTAMQQLTCSMEETTHELDFTRRALKEGTVALAASEAEVKRVLEVQRLTEEALATCKERLSNEVKTNAARENDMKHLCEDMECAKQEFRLADAQVKDLQERLKCLERTTEARLESYERKMEKGAADLTEYKDNCAGLMELIDKKDVLIHDLESKMEHGRRDLAKQVMATEQKEQELASVMQHLDTKTKMHSNLTVELATADDIIKQLDLQKRGLEEELRELKTSFSLATEAVKEKAAELEQQRRSVERLESLAEAQVVKEKELTSNAVEERDNKIARLQTALNKAHDDLQSAYELVSAKDAEKHTLSSRLSEMDAVVEKSKSQVTQLQASLQLARANLEAETERVWQQVAARTEIETKLDSWKAKAKALKEKTAELESTISKLQGEVKEWKEVVEHTENLNQMELDAWKARVATLTETNATFESSLQKSKVEAEEWKQIAENTQLLNAELEKSLHAVEDSVTGWEKVVTSVAEEGDVTKRHLEFVLKQVQEEFRCLQEDLASSKDIICSEGRTLKAEFLTFVTDSHKAEEAQSETLDVETRELEFSSVTALQAEVEVWRQKAASATEEGVEMKAQFEELLKSLQGELKTWKQFETLAREERQSRKTENAPTRIEGDEPDFFNPMSINPFHQEDEGCSSGFENDDAAQQLSGWKSKSSTVAKEGRKLTRQFRASFKHLQFELESRKQAPPPRMAKHESFVHRHANTGLEDLVKALQEEAVEVKAELAGWKSKAILAAADKEDLEKTISKLNAEVEVWKDRSAMSAGQRIVARRQLDDYSKQVKSLNADLQKWKDVATEANEDLTKVQTSLETLQKEYEDVRTELNEWMQKALEFNCRIKDLEQDVEKSRRKVEELEDEVEKWKTVAASAEEDGKSATMELLDTLGKFEDELEVMSSNSIGDCSSVGGRSLREEDLDCTSTWQRSPSGRFSNEWRPELEPTLQAEVEDLKKRVEKEKLKIQQQHETTVKELHLEVEAYKKSAEDRAESETKLKLDHATEVLSLQAELQRWKASAEDAAQECVSLHETAIKELQSELTQWKEKSETATKEANSVKANLENVIQDLEHQVRMWKQKAEKVLEGVAKSQEYEDLIKALEEELCLWTQRVKEGKALQLELEKDRAQLQESLTATHTELQKWKDRVAAVLQEEDDDEAVDTDLESELQKWKSKAIGRELLKDMLAVTLNELQQWKHKAAELSLMAEALKEELIIVVEEGQRETEELSRSSSQLDAIPQEHKSSRTDSKNSQSQRCEEKVA